MDGNMHGMGLVGLLAESNAEIVPQQTLLGEKEVNGHKIKWTLLSYDNGTNIGVFYLEWETPGKKGMSPLKHQNVAVVRLRSNDENAAQQTIDTLMETSNVGIPHLRTSKYLIANGSKVAELYKVLVTEPPATARDLANVLGQYANKSRRYSS